MGMETIGNISQINARHSSLALCVSGVVLMEPLDIRSKIVFAMFCIVQGFLAQNNMWAVVGRNSTLGRKMVEIKLNNLAS